ncbi:MAG: HAD-IIB family hydrolase [Clostridia bacterium]|nr:HAD-IIB family hydrolase [Clostridia bacterium]
MTDLSRYIIATDLDGTFFGPGGTRVERNIEAVKRFQAAGGLFTVATGRVHINIRGIIGEPAELLNAPAVLCNGAYLYDFNEKKTYAPQLMPAADAAEILRFATAEFPHIDFRVSTVDALLIARTDGYVSRDLHWYDAGTVKVITDGNWYFDEWFKIVFRDTPEHLSELRLSLKSTYGDRFSMTASGKEMLEVQSAGCNKAAGLARLHDHCGHDRILIACGDFENDIEMLQVADVAICPENAMDAVKDICHRTLCHCKDGLMGDIVDLLEKGEL